MIRFEQRGDYSKVTGYLERIKHLARMSILDKYGKEGVEALVAATPVESGTTAASWSYSVKKNSRGFVIEFHNSNINKGVPIAIILQYGHGTGTGGWVEGRDYINPAIQPIFDNIVEEAWKEVTRI